MKKNRNRWIGLLALVVLTALPARSGADELKKTRTPRLLDPAFAHLRSVVESRGKVDFDPHKAGPILDFVLSEKDPGAYYHSGETNGSTSAYHDFTLAVSLKNFLKLSYNPSLPSHLTVPSSVRLSDWSSIGKGSRPLPRLWTRLDELDAPIRVDGVEQMVNTPDLFSGAYYAYDLDRTLILFQWKGKKVMLSLSKQRGRSQVGKKGAVLGSDDQWDYLYTEQKGLNRFGLGWVDSYMYDSFSVTAYVETETDIPRLECGIFKWLDAGWAGINVVRSAHIHRGLVRFSEACKAVLEAPGVTDVRRLERATGRVRQLSDEALRKRTADYYRRLHRRHGANNPLLDEWIKGAFGAGGHIARLGRRQMEARICIEELKSFLGKAGPTGMENKMAGSE